MSIAVSWWEGLWRKIKQERGLRLIDDGWGGYVESDIGEIHERGEGLAMWTYGARSFEEERPASAKSLMYEHSWCE